jgi:hypothetical protein
VVQRYVRIISSGLRWFDLSEGLVVDSRVLMGQEDTAIALIGVSRAPHR